MSVMLSISSILSLLTFLTTVLALARIGAAAFASNQTQGHHLHYAAAAGGGSSKEALLLRFSSGEKGGDPGAVEERLRTIVATHELLRMSTNWTGMRKPRLAFPPPALLEEPQRPVSMAKLIMSRHSQRKPGRPQMPRRPPGLPLSPSRRSQVVEDV